MRPLTLIHIFLPRIVFSVLARLLPRLSRQVPELGLSGSVRRTQVLSMLAMALLYRTLLQAS